MIKSKRNKGFTLLEILLVIAAIGILAAIVLIAINPNKQIEAAREAKRKSDQNAIAKAIQQYIIEKGVYPPKLQEVGVGGTVGLCVVAGCSNGIDLSSALSDYISSIPIPDRGQYLVTKTANGVSTGYDNSNIWATAAGGTTVSPSLDLNFARDKSLIDSVSGNNPITFTRGSIGTYTGSDGLLKTAVANDPRFDHNPVTRESLGLLVEEQRTNLALYSQAIALPNWPSQQASFQTLNAVTSPDGSSNATLFFENTQNASRFIGQTISVTNAAYTVSIFAKAKERRRIMFRDSSVSGTSATFDLQSGTVVGSEGSPMTSIQPYGNGWYRCIMTYTPSSTSARLHSVFLMPDSGTSFATSTYTGDGTSGLFLYGFHVEAGATASSYIPTTTAAATRNADVASITGTNFFSWYQQDEGTWFGDAFREFAVPAGQFPVIVDGRTSGTTPNINQFSYLLEGIVGTYISVGGFVQSELYPPVFTGTRRRRIATAYAANNFAVSVNGSTPLLDSTGSVGNTPSMTIGSVAGTSQYLNGHIRRLTYWKTRLSNTTLQSLTQ